MKRDPLPWLLSLDILLMLFSLSILIPSRPAHAGPAAMAATQTDAPKTALDDDGDNDLLEHWGDPKYAREAHLQLNGLIVGIIFVSASALARRTRLERSVPNA